MPFKVIIEKYRGGRFLWNRNWDLSWIWAGWHYWKKEIWANYEQLFRPVFSSFHGQKKIKNCSVRNKKLHKVKLKENIFYKKKYRQRNLTAGLLYNDYNTTYLFSSRMSSIFMMALTRSYITYILRVLLNVYFQIMHSKQVRTLAKE